MPQDPRGIKLPDLKCFCHLLNIPDNFCLQSFLIWWNLILAPIGPPSAPGPPVPLAPRVQTTWRILFFSSPEHTWQLLLAMFFDSVKSKFDPHLAPQVPPAPDPSGVQTTQLKFLYSSPEHTWQLFLAKFFHSVKFEFDPQNDPPSAPGPRGVRGQIWIAYSLLSNMKVIPYQFGLATMSGFRDHSRLTYLRTKPNQRPNNY